MAEVLQKEDVSFKLVPASSRFRHTHSNEFSMMSWNILIKDYHYKYYGYLDDKYKKWDYRLPLIHETISNFNTDIICLQEAHLPSFQQDIGDYFIQNGNYETIINDQKIKKNKLNKKGFQRTMTTPILFKKNKFKLIYHKGSIALLQFIDIDDNEQESEEKKKLDTNKKFLWIINVHLEGDPSRPDLRFAQSKNILNRITAKTNEYKLDKTKIHIIFTGDFNAKKGEVVDELLLNGYLKWNYRQNGYDNIDIVKSKNQRDFKHEWIFQSAYDNINDDKKRKEIYTFYARNSYHCIDHIYYTSNNLKCLSCTETLPLWLSKNKNLQCPNNKIVSDHLPIASIFKIKQTNKN